jgi:nucleoside-diphosphate-sugar epimerase
MPVIVVGADSTHGPPVVQALLPREGEVRVFVTDPAAAREFRTQGAKVAIGDVSDGSHVGGAALNAFCAVVLADAATDDRIRSFATTPESVLDAWAEGIRDASVHRVIFVPGIGVEGPTQALAASAPEFGSVAATEDIAARVAELDNHPAL